MVVSEHAATPHFIIFGERFRGSQQQKGRTENQF
jgi:hypothetical protein